ncbi:MAG: protein translocase subunit SecF [Nocardioides sp.]|nr:protein translocase subunit SecF [Nocardioides sp.]
MGRYSRLGNDLYTGRRSYDFVTKRLPWYLASLVLIGAAIGILAIRGLNFGIEFTGGTEYTITLPSERVNQDTVDQLRETVTDAPQETGDPVVATVGDAAVSVQVLKLDNADSDDLIAIIADSLAIPVDDVSATEVGASLGRSLAERSAIGVGVFLVLVALLIWAYFREWKMSVAALVALAHDILITIGVYAASGFAVTPAAVTGLLAILGFSLYDTVVVFDKVRENTKSLAGTSYAKAANLAVNQTVVRSVNTSIVALLPIGAILYVSAVQLGATSLQDLALAQFVGSAVGVYSSIFVAPRVLVHLKSNETDVKMAERREKARVRAAKSDPYATVPAFSEGMAVADAPEGLEDDELDDVDEDGGERSGRVAPPRREEATGKGRTAPEARRPLGETNSSGRRQPTRQSKSERKK